MAVEDARFYEHGGIDLRGIARALMKDVAKGRLAEGGSTITQQLVKNKYLSSERSFDRKLKEAKLAMELEKKYTKAQILEMYFNEIYFGNGAQGLVQAARLYFDKRPDELTDAEAVLLAGVPKNPNKYNPFAKPADVAGRREVVLGRMMDLKLINAQQKQALQKRPQALRDMGKAPQYLAAVRAKLVERFGVEQVEQGGLDVTAALDLDLQQKAEQALRDGVKARAADLQGALICMDPANGNVLAAVGDVNGTVSSLNRAFVSRRQPGSAIKPLIYASAIQRGILASSLWSDAPASYDRGNGRTWTPMNYGREKFGTLSLRQALAYSNNIITVKLLDSIGVPHFVDFAQRFGLSLHAQSGLSLALGTDVVTLSDLAEAYTPLAASGERAESRTILKVYDRRHKAWTEIPPALSYVLDPGAAYITTQMMKDVLSYGTAKTLRRFAQSRPCAGKTGTTDNYVDAWFIGYTPRMLTGVWVGYDRPRPGGPGFTGGAVAAPIWERFMRSATAYASSEDFPQPESVVALAIDPTTGGLATEGCPKRVDEFFLKGSEPTETCTRHGGGAPISAPETVPGPTAAPEAPEPEGP